MIDLHSHILPGFDDGVRTPEEARELARAAFADGVRAIAATPHVRDDYPTRAEEMERGVALLRADLAEQGITIDVLPGGELDLDRLEELDDDELRRFSLAGSGRYLLVEFPYYGWPRSLEWLPSTLSSLRLVPVLAHPERNADVQRRPERLTGWVAEGGLVQVTAASVDGRLGRRARAGARALLERGLVHVVASDAHSPDLRACGLAAAAAAIETDELAQYLTVDAPAAIVAGEPVPPPPRRRRRRGFRQAEKRKRGTP